MAFAYLMCKENPGRGRLKSQKRAGSKHDETQPGFCPRLPLLRILPLAQLPLDSAAAGSATPRVCHLETVLQDTAAVAPNLWPCAFDGSTKFQCPGRSHCLHLLYLPGVRNIYLSLASIMKCGLCSPPTLGFPPDRMWIYTLKNPICQMSLTTPITKSRIMLCS